eukprot:64566-Pyramimonas_sp.AAC.1
MLGGRPRLVKQGMYVVWGCVESQRMTLWYFDTWERCNQQGRGHIEGARARFQDIYSLWEGAGRPRTLPMGINIGGAGRSSFFRPPPLLERSEEQGHEKHEKGGAGGRASRRS